MEQWLIDHKDAIEVIIKILGFVGIPSLLGAAYWLIRQWWRRRVRGAPFPFKIITDPEQILPALLPGTGPLADHAIPYQQRRADRDTQLDLWAKLRETGYLLVHGFTGLGKTREVGMLARVLCAEGATVLLLRRDAWLDMPAKWPQDLRNKNLLCIVDDIPFHCAKQDQHPRAGEMVTVGLPDFRERLRRTLDYFAESCGGQEVRVIATARDEPEYWEKLDFSKRDRLWRRFACYRLSEPEDAAVVRLLEEAVEQVGIPADSAEFPAIAATNDRTFANVVANLESAKREGRSLALADYRPHARETWAASYQDAVRKYPVAKYVYDALDLLAQARVSTRREMVVKLGARLWGGRWPRRLLRRWQVRLALDALVADRVLPESEGLIRPRDGQLEAKGYMLSLADHFLLLTGLVLWAASRWGEEAVYDIYGLGERLWQAREYELAARLYKRGVEVAPDEAGLYNNLGLTYDDLGQHEEAIAAYQRATELDPNYARPHNGLGNVYSDLGRPEEAIAAYQRAIELDLDFVYSYNGLGNVYSDLGRHEEAIAAYQRAIELDPNYTAPHNNLGGVYRDLGRQEQAIAAFQRTIDLDPNFAGFHYNLGLVYADLGRQEEAIAAFQRAIELDPDLAYPHNGLGNVYSDLGRQEEAIAAFQRAIELDPDLAYPHNGLGNVYSDLGRQEEAIAAYQRATELDSTLVAPHTNLGLVYRDLGRHGEAIAAYQRAIELDPSDATPHNNLGGVHLDLGRHEEAIAAFQRGIELDSNLAGFHYNLGLVYADLGRQEEAIAAYQRAIELDPDYAVTHNNLGNVYRALGRQEEAIAEYQKAIELDPNFAYPHNGLSNAYYQRGQYEEAIAAYQRALELGGLTPQQEAIVHNGLGLVYRALGRQEEAIAAYQRAIELDSTLAAPHNGLGLVYADLGRQEEAIAAFRRAIELGSDSVTPYVGLAGIYRRLGDEVEWQHHLAEARRLLKPDDHYNLACLESIAGNVDAALEHLAKASEKAPGCRQLARRDPDFDFIRDDPRFRELVGEDDRG